MPIDDGPPCEVAQLRSRIYRPQKLLPLTLSYVGLIASAQNGRSIAHDLLDLGAQLTRVFFLRPGSILRAETTEEYPRLAVSRNFKRGLRRGQARCVARTKGRVDPPVEE